MQQATKSLQNLTEYSYHASFDYYTKEDSAAQTLNF